MARVIVVVSGDFGRHVVAWLRHDGQFLGPDDIVMLDDNESVLASHPQLHSYFLGTLNEYEPMSSDRLLVGIASPAIKRELSLWAKARGVQFSTFIHRSAIVAPVLGQGRGPSFAPTASFQRQLFLDNL